jgi:DNA-binding GntR family transcriptional regulator
MNSATEDHPEQATDAENRVNEAYGRLRELIVSGRLAPGSRIIESEVATRLGVSRTPVRSALQRLRQEGYVLAANPGRQVRLSVAPLTRDDAREVFGILGEIEALAARWAAELPARRRSALAAELTALNRRLTDASRKDPVDPLHVFEQHTRFHGHFLESIDAPRLRALHRSIQPQAERYRRLYSSIFAHESHISAEEHDVIIEAVRRGAADAAQNAVQVNWRNAAERLAHAIEVLGARGSW